MDFSFFGKYKYVKYYIYILLIVLIYGGFLFIKGNFYLLVFIF